MPNKYAPLLDGFDNLASALMLAPKMAKANRIADEDRADRKAREEQALARALLLDRRHDTERAEDRQMRKDEFEMKKRESAARYPGGEVAGKPISSTLLNDMTRQAEQDAVNKGLVRFDDYTKKYVPNEGVNPQAIEGLRQSRIIKGGYNPDNYLPINEKNPFQIKIPKAEQDADAAFKAEQDALNKARLGQPAPSATPAPAPMDTNLPTDLLGIPVVQEDQNLAKDLGAVPDNRAKFVQETGINPDPKTGVTVDDLTSQDEAVRTRALGRLPAIERKKAILALMKLGYQ